MIKEGLRSPKFSRHQVLVQLYQTQPQPHTRSDGPESTMDVRRHRASIGIVSWLSPFTSGLAESEIRDQRSFFKLSIEK